MQKFIRIMAIAATILVGLSLLLLLIAYPFQNWIVKAIYGGYPQLMEGVLPLFPWLDFLFMSLELGCMLLLIVCCGNKRGGIWLEIIFFALFAMVLPGISRIVNPMYTLWMNRLGSAQVVAYSYVNNITSLCSIPSNLGHALAFVTCGMSIVFKRMSKKLASGTNA